MVHARSRAGKTDFFMGLRRTCQRLEPHSLPILPMVAHRSVRCSLGVDSNLEAVGVTPLNLRHCPHRPLVARGSSHVLMSNMLWRALAPQPHFHYPNNP